MDDALSRRGFARMTLLSGAALLAPRLALAKAPVRLSMTVTALPLPDRAVIELTLTNPSDAPVPLAPYAIVALDGRLSVPGADAVRVALERDPIPSEIDLRSRAGPRLHRIPTVLTPGSLTFYARYALPWPSSMPPGSSATLRVRPRVQSAGDPARRDRAATRRALEALRGEVTLRRTA